MCWVVSRYHKDCRHITKRDIVEKCRFYLRHDWERCRDATSIVHTVEIAQPAICPHCFRVFSDKIFDFYNPAIKEHEEMITDAEKRFEQEENENVKMSIYSEIVFLQNEVMFKKKRRDAEAAALRERYGVWREG